MQVGAFQHGGLVVAAVPNSMKFSAWLAGLDGHPSSSRSGPAVCLATGDKACISCFSGSASATGRCTGLARAMAKLSPSGVMMSR